MLRFRSTEPGFLADAEQALRVLEQRPGLVEASIGRCTDDPELWLLSMRWQNVGDYRRALSAYDVKVAAVPLLSQAIDEPTAFEILSGAGATEPNQVRPRGS